MLRDPMPTPRTAATAGLALKLPTTSPPSPTEPDPLRSPTPQQSRPSAQSPCTPPPPSPSGDRMTRCGDSPTPSASIPDVAVQGAADHVECAGPAPSAAGAHAVAPSPPVASPPEPGNVPGVTASGFPQRPRFRLPLERALGLPPLHRTGDASTDSLPTLPDAAAGRPAGAVTQQIPRRARYSRASADNWTPPSGAMEGRRSPSAISLPALPPLQLGLPNPDRLLRGRDYTSDGGCAGSGHLTSPRDGASVVPISKLQPLLPLGGGCSAAAGSPSMSGVWRQSPRRPAAHPALAAGTQPVTLPSPLPPSPCSRAAEAGGCSAVDSERTDKSRCIYGVSARNTDSDRRAVAPGAPSAGGCAGSTSEGGGGEGGGGNGGSSESDSASGTHIPHLPAGPRPPASCERPVPSSGLTVVGSPVPSIDSRSQPSPHPLPPPLPPHSARRPSHRGGPSPVQQPPPSSLPTGTGVEAGAAAHMLTPWRTQQITALLRSSLGR